MNQSLMSEIFTSAFIISVLVGAIRAGTPLLFATLGEIINERAGVVNLGVEGMMIVGALAGFMGSYYSQNPWLGVLAAILCGGLISLLHGFLCITLKSDQIVSGIMLVLLGIGLTSFIGESMVGISGYGFEPVIPTKYAVSDDSLTDIRQEDIPERLLQALTSLKEEGVALQETAFLTAIKKRVASKELADERDKRTIRRVTGQVNREVAKYKTLLLTHAHVWNLTDIPFFGPVVFQYNILVYLAVILVPIVWAFLFKTRLGLEIIAVGEDPSTADTLGISVERTRYVCVCIGGMLAGLGGSFLSLGYTRIWVEHMTAGRGWIAVALVIFAAWTPQRALLGAYLFGGIEGLQLRLQTIGVGASPHLLGMMPYAATILVLLLSAREEFRRRMGAPEALLKPYIRGARD